MKKKRHDAQLKKTTESKKKEDENLVKSAGGQTKPQETKEYTTIQQQSAPAPVSSSSSSQSRKEQKYTRSVTMDASMINRGNGVVQKQYNGMSGGSISGMQSANPPVTPGGSYAKPTFGSSQFTSGGSRASSGERKGANFQIGSQRGSPVENQQANLFKRNNNNSSTTATTTTTNNTVSSSSNKLQSSQHKSSQLLLKQHSESTSSSTSSQNQSSTSNSSKLARNKSMPASSLSKKEQFLAKLEQNADPNRGLGSGGSSFKNARSAFNGAGSSSGSVKRGSSFVVPNATGVKQLLLRWCQQRTNGYDVSVNRKIGYKMS